MKTFFLLASLLFLIALPVFMVRDLLGMYKKNDRGGSASGGVAGMMAEIDRAVRPSSQHIVEAQKSRILEEDDIGGE